MRPSVFPGWLQSFDPLSDIGKKLRVDFPRAKLHRGIPVVLKAHHVIEELPKENMSHCVGHPLPRMMLHLLLVSCDEVSAGRQWEMRSPGTPSMAALGLI
jgi:hypothetical protein